MRHPLHYQHLVENDPVIGGMDEVQRLNYVRTQFAQMILAIVMNQLEIKQTPLNPMTVNGWASAPQIKYEAYFIGMSAGEWEKALRLYEEANYTASDKVKNKLSELIAHISQPINLPTEPQL